MPLAITLRLDAATAAQIDFLAASFPDRPRSGRYAHHHYPAHIKLAMYGDGVDVADLDAALATATGAWKKLPITLMGLGVFPGEPAIPMADSRADN